MRKQNALRSGLTLIELMIVVAIMGILAALAIPAFSSYQNRSRRADAMTNVSAIAKSEVAFFATGGVFHGTNPLPGGGLSSAKRPWNAAAMAEYEPLGYQPEGAVYYDYEVNTFPTDCACPVGLNGEAVC